MSPLVREAIGPDLTMMVDVVYCWTEAKVALRVLNQMEQYNPFFLETPLQLDNLDGYAYLHDNSPVRIAAGELQNTRFEFADLIDRGKVDVAQPDVGRVGGLTEARRVADMAADRGRLRSCPTVGKPESELQPRPTWVPQLRIART